MMKALTYLKPGVIRWAEVAKPKIRLPTDVVGKVLATTICGSDLHIVGGHIPSCNDVAASKPGRGFVLGHEGIIKVEQVGSGVKNFKPGDVCIVSCITSCGECYYCKRDLQSFCTNTEGTSGMILGVQIDGTQAEYLRVPFADHSMYKAPEGIPLESSLMLSDILPTSYEVGILAGHVQEGDSVAIVGLGPIGLSALVGAKSLNPQKIIAIDMDESRLEVAKKLGADEVINPAKDDVAALVKKYTADQAVGRQPGVDVAIEAVGAPATFELCQKLIGPGGAIANIGVHSKPATIDLPSLWIKNIRLTSGIVNTFSIKELLDKVAQHKLDPSVLVSHHFKMSEFEKAYDVFSHASKTKAVKMMITPD